MTLDSEETPLDLAGQWAQPDAWTRQRPVSIWRLATGQWLRWGCNQPGVVARSSPGPFGRPYRWVVLGPVRSRLVPRLRPALYGRIRAGRDGEGADQERLGGPRLGPDVRPSRAPGCGANWHSYALLQLLGGPCSTGGGRVSYRAP